MNRIQWTLDKVLLGLALLAALGIAFTMTVMPFHAEEVFLRRDTLSVLEVVMLVGFVIVFLFNVLSVPWLAGKVFAGERKVYLAMLGLGLLCLVFMGAEKVMIDEVGHEWQPGSGVQGEAVILYVLLTIQFIYIALVAWLLRSRRTKATFTAFPDAPTLKGSY